MFLNAQGKIELGKKQTLTKIFRLHITNLGTHNGLVKHNQEPKSSTKLGLPSSMGLFNSNPRNFFAIVNRRIAKGVFYHILPKNERNSVLRRQFFKL